MDAVRPGDTFDKRYYLENLYRLFEGLPETPDKWRVYSIAQSKVLNQVDFKESYVVVHNQPGLYAGEITTIEGYHVDGVYNIALSSDWIRKF